MMSVKLTGSEVDQFHSMSGPGFTAGSQLILTDGFPLISMPNAFWLDTLTFPAYATVFSALVLLLHGILLSNLAKNLYRRVFSVKVTSTTDYTPEECYNAHTVGFFAEIKEHVSSHGGPVIFAYMTARLIGCLALLGLSLATFILAEGKTKESYSGVSGMGNKHKHRHWQSFSLSKAEWLQVAMCTSSAYASLLALVSITARPNWSRLITKHLVSLLLVTFGVYAYRDLWPLATYTLSPKDQYEGWILWAKITVITLIAIVIPFTIPRQYIPFDPKDPAPEANPEQTASLGAILVYTFLDPIIFLAYRVPHLAYDKLPPLADYDHAKNLVKNAFPHLDPYTNRKPRRRHLVFGLLRVFRRQYTVMAIMVIIEVVCGFARPLGINRLLNYLQNRGETAVVRPWLWVVVLMTGTMVGNCAFQYYVFTATRSLVRTEAIITQLVFEHSLRIRMKVETPGSTTASGVTTPTLGNDSNANGIGEAQGSPNESGSSLTVQSNTTSINSTSSKGKQKAKEVKISEHLAKSKKEESNSDNLIGKINNLVTTDLGNITEARDFLLLILHVPLQIALGIWFLYVILGWSAFVGFGVMLLMFPIPGYIAGRIQHVQMTRMKKTDARVQTVTETMNVLRMIKLFGWELKMNKRLADKRQEELVWLWARKLLELATNNVNYLIPVLIMLVTYGVYTLIMKQELSASKVFSSMAVFDMLLDQLHMIGYYLQMVVQAKVSLDRVDDFLKNTELLDSFTDVNQTPEHGELLEDIPVNRNVIGFHNATFSWSNDSIGTLTPSRRNFTLRIEDELIFKHGCINLVVGPTGSGKTSVLMALLGEMHFTPSGPDSWFNLPREGGVAYAAQESWVQNETIRENIIFGAPFDEARYNQVIYQCGLERDLALFEAGDRTEVGEKGLTLSGGQKARVTLARAVYSSANILLLDDVLAALDVHTAKWIVEKCFRGDLIRGKTVILVTHNVAIASPVAGFVVSLGLDGRVLSQGDVSDVLAKDHTLAIEVSKNEELIEKAENEIDLAGPNSEKKQSDGKLTVKEEIEEGHVSWSALKLYFLNLSRHPHLFWFVFLGGNFLSELVPVVQTWYLGYWASQYDTHPATEVAAYSYLTVYTLLLIVAVLIYNVTQFIFYWGSVRASKKIHEKLIESVLGTTLRWLDTTPTSRVITRCTQDIRAVDGPIPWGLSLWLQYSTSMLTKFAAVMLFTPMFIVPGMGVASLGFWCGQVYMKAQLSVKREMSNAKAPVLGHFGAAIAGLISIRAYGAQQTFRKESLARIDRYTSSATTFYNLNRWVSIRIDTLGEAFAAGLAAYLIYGQNILPIASDAGFSLNMAIGFSSVLLWCVRLFNDFEVNGNSLERIQEYIAIDQEPKDTEAGTPPAYWPASGDVKVENLSARYSSDGPKVLHDISFHIKPGERVGVVGRTGSGKSSLTLSLLRCILTDGTVYYDGLPTKSVNLSALRSSITIIPQIPELLSGTLRQNLDPFDQYEDATLNDALRAAGLYSLQSEDDEGRITLDSAISSGGDNVSVGQRQILALARAIIRGSKLLILDEATSAIDYKTDEVIQTSLRHQLSSDTSLITVAHRLQTIMDADKIMVLDAGKIAEFDSPTELLKNEKGMLRALVDHSGDKENLYAIAERKASASKSF